MSFWDSLGGLFTGDTYFPDNPPREARAKELARDCQNYTLKLSLTTKEIQSDLLSLNADLAKLYGDPKLMPAGFKPEAIKFNELVFEVSGLLAPLIAAPAISSALTLGATSYLLGTGEIGAAAFAELVGLPAIFEIGIGATAGVVAIGISFGIGAISGAVKRDKLRDAIHSGFRARQGIVKAYLVDAQLASSIDAMMAAINALKAAEVPIEKVMAKIKEMVSAATDRANSIDDRSTASYLTELDHSRGSWLNEDY